MIITQGLLKATPDGKFRPALMFKVNQDRQEFDHIYDFLSLNDVRLTFTNAIDEVIEDKGDGLVFKDALGNHFIFWIEDAYVE